MEDFNVISGQVEQQSLKTHGLHGFSDVIQDDISQLFDVWLSWTLSGEI